MTLRFLTLRGCHLCDDARPILRWAARRSGVLVDEIDIDTDDHLTGLYGLRIPVVLDAEDQVVAEGVITDRGALAEAIRDWVGSQPL